MANIGLAYTDVQLYGLLAPVNHASKVLIGLTFKPVVKGNKIECKIKRVIRTLNATTNPIAFETPGAGQNTLKKSLYRENGGVLVPATNPSHYTAGDTLQFIDLENLNFSFFSRDAILTLIAVSEEVVISGSQFTPGMMAYPPANLGSNYGTLKMEVNRDLIKINSGADNDKIPSATIGNPCPPTWNPFQ